MRSRVAVRDEIRNRRIVEHELLRPVRGIVEAADGIDRLFVEGYPGTGKTFAAIHRAACDLDAGRRTLVLCHNIPLAASLGQMILFENVWNRMMYDHDKPPEQSAERFVKFIDSFNSPWVGLYYDIGNHWKYGQPAEWIHALGRRSVKLDIKGFSRAKDKFVDITSPEDDVPWDKVREALAAVGFTGWATAEVGGGDVQRLTVVREQMQKALGV